MQRAQDVQNVDFESKKEDGGGGGGRRAEKNILKCVPSKTCVITTAFYTGHFTKLLAVRKKLCRHHRSMLSSPGHLMLFKAKEREAGNNCYSFFP